MDGEARTRLRVAIAQSGKKANAISQSFDWPATYVSRILNGQIKSPDPTRLLRICQAVDADIAYVLTGERMSDNRKPLMDEISEASPDVIDQVANFVRQIGLDKK